MPFPLWLTRLVRLVVIIVGALTAFAGWAGYSSGMRWVFGYNAQTGTFGYQYSFWYVIFGIALIVGALIPWSKIK